ncbi:MAG TPA: DUF4403 family protein [Gemmatimonadaceae bacterium]
MIVAPMACQRAEVALPSDLPDAAPPAPPAELSRFTAPLDYDFTTVLHAVDRAVPTTFGSMDSVKMVGNDSHRHYAYAATRSPFEAFADGKLVHLRSTLAYTARGYFKPMIGPTISAGCGNGKDKPRIEVELSTPLTLNSDWHLASHASLEHVSPASDEQRDHCDVSILHRDVTDRVVGAAKEGIVQHLGDIDRRIADVNLHDRFNGWWGLLAKPIRLRDGLWLLLRPQRLAIGEVTGHEHVLTIPVTLEARPEIVTTETEPRTDTLPLPPLGHDTPGRGFHIALDGVVDYVAASAVVDNALAGKQVHEANRTITVSNVAVMPASGGRLALSVNFTGDAHGLLRFTGTPKYDSVARMIVVPDLDYDLATDDQLIRAYSWIRSDAVRATLREKARFPVDSALARGKELLLSGLNRRVGTVMTLKASVDAVGVRGLFVTRAGIVVRADASGRASVAVVPE